MKLCLKERKFDIYENDAAEKLAKKTLELFYGEKVNKSHLPIDPFGILKASGVVYHFADFENLEGFYLMPEKNSNDVAVVGIKKNSVIQRQRFTAAHELCHHLKDEVTIYCKDGDTNPIEEYANNFARHLLMPTELIEIFIDENNLLDKISEKEYLDRVLKISYEFGTSFQATLNVILNKTKRRLQKNPQKTRETYGVKKNRKLLNLSSVYILQKQIFDSLEFLKWQPDEKAENDFIRLLITSDHRMEKGTLSVEKISQTLARIRFGEDKEKLCESLSENDLDLLGQYEMYKDVFSCFEDVNISYVLFLLHQKLYKFTNHEGNVSELRRATALIKGTNVNTNDPSEINNNLQNLYSEYRKILSQKDKHTKSDYLDFIVWFHHQITVIHPFIDGNGRTTRAYLNKQLYTFGIPLSFIESDKKDEYREALKECDEQSNYESLFSFFMNSIISVYNQVVGNR